MNWNIVSIFLFVIALSIALIVGLSWPIDRTWKNDLEKGTPLTWERIYPSVWTTPEGLECIGDKYTPVCNWEKFNKERSK